MGKAAKRKTKNRQKQTQKKVVLPVAKSTNRVEKEVDSTEVIYAAIGFGELRVQDLLDILNQCDPYATVSINVMNAEDSDGTIQCVQRHYGNPEHNNFGEPYRPCEIIIHHWEPDWEEDYGDDGIKVISRGGIKDIFVTTEDPPLDQEFLNQMYEKRERGEDPFA